MQIVVTDPGALETARTEVDAELDAVEAAASRFRPDSEVIALARAGGRPTEVSAVLANLLDAALTAADQTDGDVDPAVGAASIELAGDASVARSGVGGPRLPPPATPPHWSAVSIEGCVVTVPSGVVLDLGATAKALAADQSAERVHRATGSGVLINLGGDVATAGPAPDDGWQVLIRDADGDPESVVALPAGAALATSSTIRRRWRHDDHWVHHILDPRTGHSADPVWRTVSVAATTCYAANTVSTASVVRGWRALEWISHLGMAARLVDRDRGVHTVGTWPSADAEARR